MKDLFISGDDDYSPAFRSDEPARLPEATVRERRDDDSATLNELAADMAVVEESNRTSAVRLFVDENVGDNWQILVQSLKGSARCVGVAVFVDPNEFGGLSFERFDTNDIEAFGNFLPHINGGIDETYAFERKPLYVQVNAAGEGNLRVLGLHLKSKGIFRACEWSKWWRIADANRRTVLAQAILIGLGFLDTHMIATETKEMPLIVRGDTNEESGLDTSEKRFFGSSVERLIGTVWGPELCLRNTLDQSLTDEERAELDFGAIATTSFQDPIFNNTRPWEWIDHDLHDEFGDEPWVTNAEVRHNLPGSTPVWETYPHASDYYFVSAVVIQSESLEGV